MLAIREDFMLKYLDKATNFYSLKDRVQNGDESAREIA